MIRDIKKINRGGLYFADFRYDEGVRVREDPISPTLCKDHDMRGMSSAILLIEITDDKDNQCNE